MHSGRVINDPPAKVGDGKEPNWDWRGGVQVKGALASSICMQPHQPHDGRTRGILRERGLIRTKTSDTGAPLDAAFLGAARASSNARNRRIRPLPARALDPFPFPPQKPRVRGLLASRNPGAESPLPGIVTENVVPTLRICREQGIKLNPHNLSAPPPPTRALPPTVTTAEGHQVLEVVDFGGTGTPQNPSSSSDGYLCKKEAGAGDGPGKPSAEGERERVGVGEVVQGEIWTPNS